MRPYILAFLLFPLFEATVCQARTPEGGDWAKVRVSIDEMRSSLFLRNKYIVCGDATEPGSIVTFTSVVRSDWGVSEKPDAYHWMINRKKVNAAKVEMFPETEVKSTGLFYMARVTSDPVTVECNRSIRGSFIFKPLWKDPIETSEFWNGSPICVSGVPKSYVNAVSAQEGLLIMDVIDVISYISGPEGVILKKTLNYALSGLKLQIARRIVIKKVTRGYVKKHLEKGIVAAGKYAKSKLTKQEMTALARENDYMVAEIRRLEGVLESTTLEQKVLRKTMEKHGVEIADVITDRILVEMTMDQAEELAVDVIGDLANRELNELRKLVVALSSKEETMKWAKKKLLMELAYQSKKNAKVFLKDLSKKGGIYFYNNDDDDELGFYVMNAIQSQFFNKQPLQCP